MNLSKQTLDLLKNFTSVNSNLVINPGKVQQTISTGGGIMVSAEFEEDFPKEAAFYNMGEFLGVVSLFEKPEFDFDDKFVTIKEASSRTQIKYVYSETSLLTTPKKKFNMPPATLSLDFTADNLGKMQKAASALGVGDLAIIGDGKTLTARVFDVRNPTSNIFDLDLGASTVKAFEAYFKLDRFAKLYPGNYTVDISDKGVAQCKHEDIKYTSWIGIESNSKFS